MFQNFYTAHTVYNFLFHYSQCEGQIVVVIFLDCSCWIVCGDKFLPESVWTSWRREKYLGLTEDQIMDCSSRYQVTILIMLSWYHDIHWM